MSEKVFNLSRYSEQQASIPCWAYPCEEARGSTRVLDRFPRHRGRPLIWRLGTPQHAPLFPSFHFLPSIGVDSQEYASEQFGSDLCKSRCFVRKCFHWTTRALAPQMETELAAALGRKGPPPAPEYLIFVFLAYLLKKQPMSRS